MSITSTVEKSVPGCANVTYQEDEDQLLILYRETTIETSWKEIQKFAQYSSSRLSREITSKYRGTNRITDANKRIALYAFVTAYQRERNAFIPKEFKGV